MREPPFVAGNWDMIVLASNRADGTSAIGALCNPTIWPRPFCGDKPCKIGATGPSLGRKMLDVLLPFTLSRLPLRLSQTPAGAQVLNRHPGDEDGNGGQRSRRSNNKHREQNLLGVPHREGDLRPPILVPVEPITLADECRTSAPQFFASVDLGLAHLTGRDQSLHASLGQTPSIPVHAGSERRSLKPIFVAMSVIIGGASLLHRLAVSRSGKRCAAAANDESKND
jgi:hypothetical protein